MDQVTARQQRIIDFIRETVADRGYPPTVREIGEAVGLTSSSSVHAQLENLQRKGVLRKDPSKPRAIDLGGERRPEAIAVPLIGRVAAGSPVMAEEAVEDVLAIPAGMLSAGPEHFALRVTGDSMTGAGILDGDIVVVRPQDVAEDGAIVAAVLPGVAEDEATVKRLKRKGSVLWLHPENPALEPFPMPEGGRVVGVVSAVLRSL